MLAVVYSFAVEPGLAPVGAVAPFEVFARQLPRLLVNLLNGDEDRGYRFFPLMGHDGSVRRFFTVGDLMPSERVIALHGQKPTPAVVVDGRIQAGAVRMRIVDGTSGAVRLDEELPFAVDDPLPTVRRMMFELTGEVGQSGALPAVPALAGDALQQYLVARDDLLTLEAKLLRDEHGLLDAGLAALEAAPQDEDVQRTFGALIAHIERASSDKVGLGAAVRRAVQALASAEHDPAARRLSMALAGLLDRLGEDDAATEVYVRLAEATPTDEFAVGRAASALFPAGAVDRAFALLQAHLATGRRSPSVLAQIAAIHLFRGERDEHRDVMDELAALDQLPSPVARVVAVDRIDRGEPAEGVAVIEAALAHSDAPQPELRLELARACLLAGEEAKAESAIEAVLRCDPPPRVRTEAQRMRRLAARPGALNDMRIADEALESGHTRTALGICRRLTANHPELAEGWLLLGVCHQRRGNARRAERSFRKALELDPDQGEAHNRIGVLMLARGRAMDGYRHLSRAAKQLPEDAGVRIHLAQAFHSLDRPADAVSALDEAARLGGDAEIIARVRSNLRSA